MIERALRAALRPVWARLRRIASRAVLRLVDDARTLQAVQVQGLAGETSDAAEHWQGYGLTVHPHPGGEALVLSLGAERAHPVVVAVADRRYRLTGLAQGEVALYDDQGQRVTLYRDRIEVEAPKVVVLSDDVHLGAEGGPRVARIGDRVNVGSGSSAGLWPIVEGSDQVRCAGASVS